MKMDDKPDISPEIGCLMEIIDKLKDIERAIKENSSAIKDVKYILNKIYTKV